MAAWRTTNSCAGTLVSQSRSMLFAEVDIFTTTCKLGDFRAAYDGAYLHGQTGIINQYNIYFSPIPMLQTGIGFEVLRGGHKKCLCLAATISCRVRSDFLRLAGSAGKTQYAYSFKLGICRFHA